MGQSAISVNCGAKYKNYPFYDWMPKPLGIILLILLFIPILTVGGVYTANSGEMMSGLGIQSEHIQFIGFVTSIGMASFSPFFYQLVCIRREKIMCVIGFSVMYILSYVCAVTDSIFVLALCSLVMGFSAHGAHDGESVHAHTLRFRNGGHAEHNARQRADR